MDAQRLDRPQAYEIRLKGYLDARRAATFEGLAVVQEPGGETVLTGIVIDQAALHGLLERIRDLALPLLSVRRMPAHGAGAEGVAQERKAEG